MKVLIDASTLTTPKSGVGHYVFKIASALLSDSKFEVNFFASNNFHHNLNSLREIKKENIISRLLKKNIKIKYLIKNRKLDKFIKEKKIDLFHQPNFITYNLKIKNVSTVHDLSWIHYPQFFLKEELKYFELYFERSLKYSTKIIVHSNFIKNELCNMFNLPEHLISVVYEDIRTDLKNLKEDLCYNFLNKFKLKYKNFFLIINSLEYRKNYNFILDIYQKLDLKTQEKFPLIIFGMRGRYSDSILDKIKDIKNCKYFGYLEEDLLNQCLSSAKILFYPSIYEGFGISPLESMAAGTPVVASKIDVTCEILKDNAFLVDLNDDSEWIKKIMSLIDDEKIYNKMVQKGINHSLNFTNGNTVNQILNIYKNI